MTRCVLFNNVDESIFKINGRTIYSARPIAIIEYKRVKKKKKPRLLLVLKIFVLLFIFIFYDFFFFCVRSMVNFVFQCTKCSTTTWKKKKCTMSNSSEHFAKKRPYFVNIFVSREVWKKLFLSCTTFHEKIDFTGWQRRAYILLYSIFELEIFFFLLHLPRGIFI